MKKNNGRTQKSTRYNLTPAEGSMGLVENLPSLIGTVKSPTPISTCENAASPNIKLVPMPATQQDILLL